MSDSELLFYASLVRARPIEPGGWVVIPDAEDQSSYFATTVKKAPWAKRCQSNAVTWFAEGALWKNQATKENTETALKNLRHETKRAIARFTKTRDPYYRLLEPEQTREKPPRWRVPLEDVGVDD